MTSPRTHSGPAELLVHLARAGSATTQNRLVLLLGRRGIRQHAAHTAGDFAHSTCGLCWRPYADHRSLQLERPTTTRGGSTASPQPPAPRSLPRTTPLD